MESPLDVVFTLPTHFASATQIQRLHSTLTEQASAAQQIQLQALLVGQRKAEFQTLLWASEFAAQILCGDADWLITLLEQDSILQSWQQADYQKWFCPDTELSPADWDRFLRRQRNRAMARIIWLDFNRLNDTQATVGELSLMAETALQASLDYHYPKLCADLGTPTDDKGNRQPLLIIGMGKLGAWELNLSSDIDLIFAYPSNGETQGGRKGISNQEFFTKLGQRLIQSLDQNTPEGFVFRVDMRLRPYGQSGALVSNYNALEDYYQTQGREWERFAMIKARVVASNADSRQINKLMTLLRSFTYRGYVDFSAIDALRTLKQLINREVVKRRQQDNVKLGRGGIREVEFIAQAFQIIRGGKDTELQERRLLKVLPILDQLNCLPPGIAQQLAEAYCFLRNVEHAIQGYQDKQTQDLPQQPEAQARIARVMGFADWPTFQARLKSHCDFIHQQFEAVIATPDELQNDAYQNNLNEWRSLWHTLQKGNQEQHLLLSQLGFDHAEQAQTVLQSDLLRAPPVVAMAALGRERFEQLMPRLLARIAECDQPCETLTRLVPLLTAIARRSAYLLLLIENPGALNQLVNLTNASPWISAQLSQHPALLDELLDPTSLYSVPSKHELTQELRLHALRIAEDDLETHMETLRYFRSAHALRVAACEVSQRLPLMKVSDYLTELAEVILEHVLNLAWRQMVARHGYPDNTFAQEPSFLIVGYGKLGGIELAHGSDLDLVFIHDADPLGHTGGEGEGQRSIDNLTFYVRLGQKIIHILNSHTPAGQLYEVDMRLRPSGNSGLLVTSFSGFEKYQEEAAWTWEHQALVRARAINQQNPLAVKFQTLRKRILCRRRDPLVLCQEVVEMRKKMREQLGSNKKQRQEGQFHLKQDAGGIVDIEFMVQYAVLAWAHNTPELTEFTDNIRILGCLAAAGQLSTQEVNQLIEAYKAYRSLGHRLALQQQPGFVSVDTVESERQIVTQIWQRLLDFKQND